MKPTCVCQACNPLLRASMNTYKEGVFSSVTMSQGFGYIYNAYFIDCTVLFPLALLIFCPLNLLLTMVCKILFLFSSTHT
jgi:hypothetical protein